MNVQLDLVLSVPANLNPDNVQVRMAGMQDAPLFCLADVCKVLEIGDVGRCAARLPDDEKGVRLAHTLGGPQQMVFVTEPGFYRVVMRSDKPAAKDFTRWVCHEVLPCIRKHGCYPAPVGGQQANDDLRDLMMQFMASVATAITGIAQQVKDLTQLVKEQVRAGQFTQASQFIPEGGAIGLREQIRKLWRGVTERQLEKCVNRIRRICQQRKIDCWQPVEHGPYVVNEIHVSIINDVVTEQRAVAEAPLFGFNRQTILN